MRLASWALCADSEGGGGEGCEDDGESSGKLRIMIISYLAGFSQKMALDPVALALKKVDQD